MPTIPIQTEVPIGLFTQLQELVDNGWYGTIDEALLDALRQFLDSHRADLMDEFIRQDVEWGLTEG
jgi:hypothetical protein